jgi:hypothetical protein
METFIGAVMVIEAALLSSLLAVWMTWLALRGPFELMPAAGRHASPIRFQAGQQKWIRKGGEA